MIKFCKNNKCNELVKIKKNVYCSRSCSNTDIKQINKVKSTKMRKYGDETYTNRTLFKLTCLKNHGVNHNWKIKGAKETIKSTWVSKLGVDNPFKSIELMGKVDKQKNMENRKETMLKKYGVDNYSKTTEFKEREHKTKKEKGSYGKSKSEDEFYKYLKRYVDPKIERQVRCQGFNIDFYSPQYDIYIQFDGDYWHGYLNTEEQLNQTERGRYILKVKKRDEEQNRLIPNLIRIRESKFLRKEKK